MYFGAEASAFTRSQAEGKPVRVVLQQKETRDRYGRLLAYVYLGRRTMLNEQIIAQGYGYAYTPYPHPWKQRFIDIEKTGPQAEGGPLEGRQDRPDAQVAAEDRTASRAWSSLPRRRRASRQRP